MGKLTNLTVKGQVTIPKDVRDALGLKPNEPVEIEWTGGDEAVIRRPRHKEVSIEERMEAARSAMEEAFARFPMLPTSETTDDYMALIRDPVPIPDPDDLR